MALSRAQIKTFFETGDIPEEAEFGESIDSIASLKDTNLFEAENTHDADIILEDDKVQKAASGGGTLDLRNLVDDAVALSPDTVNFLKGWLFANSTTANIGFSQSSAIANNASEIICLANSLIFNTETVAGVFAKRLEILEDKTGYNGNTPIPRPVVTGSRGGNAALTSMLTAFDSLGIITDSTTA